jgi:tetratricopeptide (TPR) repeat protein
VNTNKNKKKLIFRSIPKCAARNFSGILQQTLLSIILFLICASPLAAKIYDIPPELLEEAKAKRIIFKQSPGSAEAKFELAMAYAYTGRVRKGWAMLKEVPEPYAKIVKAKYTALSKKEPKEWKHRFKLAFGYFFLKRKDDAINEFKKVLEIDPQQVWAMGFIALIEGERNNTAECMVWCNKALEIEPNATGVHFLLAEAYRRKGNFFKAFTEACIVGRLVSEEAVVRPDEDD